MAGIEGRSQTGAPTIEGGRYELVERLGEGGTAVVYRAFDTQGRIWCAVKVLLPQYAQRPKLRARFEQEAVALARVVHPNVIRIFDVGVAGALPYIVMELADAGSLADWTNRYGAMPPRRAVEVVLQSGEGLAAAHAAGIVHRDIKPQNVLVSREGVCKLTDFGIAQINSDDLQAQLTRTGSVMGTRGYMAPEQLVDAKAVDARADVYALAATLYALLTNQLPIDLFMIGTVPERIAPVPHALRPVLLKAAQYQPDDRFPDVKSFLAALRNAMASLPPLGLNTPRLGAPRAAGLQSDTWPEIDVLLDNRRNKTLGATSGNTNSGVSQTSGPIGGSGWRPDAPSGGLSAPVGLNLKTPPAPSGGRPAAPAPKVLPYTMPNAAPPTFAQLQEDRRAPAAPPPPPPVGGLARRNTPPSEPVPDDGLPAYADRSRQAPARPPDDGLPSYADRSAGAARPQRFPTPPPAPVSAAPVEEPPPPEPPANHLGVYAAALVPALLLIAVLVWSITGAHNARDNADQAAASLYQVLAGEHPIIDKLAAAGADPVELEQLYRAWDREPDERARSVAAAKYQARIRAEIKQRRPSDPEVSSGLARMEEARAAWDQAVAEWSASSRGALAMTLGLAEKPPAP